MSVFADLGRQLQAKAEQAVKKTLEDLKAEAVAATSGSLSPADLRRLDHPYARRHGVPGLDPDTLNVGTGALRASWQTEGPLYEGGVLTGRLFNTDPKAGDWLEPGTRTMFPRAPHEKAAAKVEPDLLRRLEELFG